MLFVDYLGSRDLFASTRQMVQERVAAVFRVPFGEVVVRLRGQETDYAGVEIWVEVSSDEQVYRYGRQMARELSEAIRTQHDVDVWTMFRVVPLERAFLNGVPRRRDATPLAD